jgi:hypothetical protein
VLLSITASPGVRSITITSGDRVLALHMYARSTYGAVVARGRECLVGGEDLRRAAWLLTRLMDRVGELLKSRYYTYTGPLEVVGDRVVYRPYVSPTSTAEVVLSGKTARVASGEFRRRFSTSLDVGAVLRRYLELLEKC